VRPTRWIKFAGGLLLAPGLYQLLPFKRMLLSCCTPAAYSVRWPVGIFGAFRNGMQHGLWSWLLLGLDAVAVCRRRDESGAVIAALTLFVLFEKIVRFGLRSTLVSGGLLTGPEFWVIAR
jgi:predicted metal-binding membrane protein